MNKRIAIASGIAGLTLIGLGAWAYSRERKLLSGATPRTLGRGRPPQAPIVSSYSDGNMRTTLRSAPNMSIEQRLATIQDLVHKSIQDPQMRKISLQATAHCPERDGLCEAKAIYDFIKQRVRYTGDIAPIRHPDGTVDGIDLYQSARRTLEFGGGDCLPISTLVLRDDYELVPLIELDAGDRILAGGGQWAVVKERWLTGEKELLEFELSNGCVLRCTPEHRIFRSVGSGERYEEIRAGEARVDDCLITPDLIPTAGNDGHAWPDIAAHLSNEDLAWLVGVFVADGWADGKHTRDGWHPYRVGISGRDGQRKEEQKRRVVQLMEAMGVSTRWHERYVAINDSALARFFAEMGSGAPNKHLVTLRQIDQAQVRALLEGLSADADQRSNVFATTSPALALQLRVLYRMLGQSTHIKRVDDHGGLGKHPIYRVTPRAADNDRRDIRFARIRAIHPGGSDQCMDLVTDIGSFWLPESDVVVHNCDDHNILGATMLAHNGITPKMRVVKTRGAPDWEHIYVGALLPKGGGEKFISLDTTLPGANNFGVEPSYHKHIDFDA